MDITFQKKDLKDYANSDRKGIRKLGSKRHHIFKKRLDQLKAAKTLEDVRQLPGHFHELIGDRKGQWACNLDQPYRLLFTPQEEPIPVDQDGKYIWIEIKGVEIIEIKNYHKEK